jgi:hypothetical protein
VRVRTTGAELGTDTEPRPSDRSVRSATTMPTAVTMSSCAPGDTGDGDIYFYFVGGEPPLGQWTLHDGVWVPMVPDGFALMDRIIDGDAEFSYVGSTPPEGVPAPP